MCFYNDDYDWVARDEQQQTIKANGKSVCYDCNERPAVGEDVVRTEMWEYEPCCDCGKRHPEDEECADFDADVGESSSMIQCRACLAFRDAIKALEISEGCKEYEATPRERLCEEFGNMGDRDRVREYLDAAKAASPEFAGVLEERYGRFA